MELEILGFGGTRRRRPGMAVLNFLVIRHGWENKGTCGVAPIFHPILQVHLF